MSSFDSGSRSSPSSSRESSWAGKGRGLLESSRTLLTDRPASSSRSASGSSASITSRIVSRMQLPSQISSMSSRVGHARHAAGQASLALLWPVPRPSEDPCSLQWAWPGLPNSYSEHGSPWRLLRHVSSSKQTSAERQCVALHATWHAHLARTPRAFLSPWHCRCIWSGRVPHSSSVYSCAQLSLCQSSRQPGSLRAAVGAP